LITQWYWDNNKIRRAELAEALRRNLMNSHIHRIHLIGGDEKETLLKAYADDIQVQDLVHQKIEWVSAVHNGLLMILFSNCNIICLIDCCHSW
jgi:hypothetical protein